MKAKTIFMAGRVKLWGDNVNTDTIHNPQKFTIDRGRLTAAEGRPEPGIIIAGENAGIGSSRFSTVIALKNSGFTVLAARSISRIFERNLAWAGIFPVTIGGNFSGAKEGGFMSVEIKREGGDFAAVFFDGKKPLFSGKIDEYLFAIASGKEKIE